MGRAPTAAADAGEDDLPIPSDINTVFASTAVRSTRIVAHAMQGGAAGFEAASGKHHVTGSAPGARDFLSEELCVPFHRHNLVIGAGDNRDRDVDKGKTVGQESVC
jgi:hypothetical protein